MHDQGTEHRPRNTVEAKRDEISFKHHLADRHGLTNLQAFQLNIAFTLNCDGDAASNPLQPHQQPEMQARTVLELQQGS